MTGLTINVDFDGVLVDFRNSAEEMLTNMGCQPVGPDTISVLDHPEWSFYKGWVDRDGEQVTGKQFWTWVNENVNAPSGWLEGGPVLYRDGDLIEGAQLGITGIAGHRIRIVTSKVLKNKPEAIARTIDALAAHHIPYDALVANVSSLMNKSDYRADVVIDDNPRWRDWYQEGALNIMFSQPWNAPSEMSKFFEWPPDDVRWGNWETIPEMVAEHADMLDNTREEVFFTTQPATMWVGKHEQEPLFDLPPVEPALAHAEEAIRLVYGDRQADYGHPYDDYSRTVNSFNALTGHNLSVLEGGLFMVLVKLSRQMNVPKDDNMVDAHGYLMVMDRILEREET